MIVDRDLWVSASGVLHDIPSPDLPGSTCLALAGQSLSVRAQLLYGLEMVDGRVEQTGSYDPSYLPCEGDDGDVPAPREDRGPR
jgi:hypothetical protein